MELKNRIVMNPLSVNYASRDGFVTDAMISYLVERAKGGVGLIQVENAAIDPYGRTVFNHFIYDDKFIPGLRKLVNAVHAHGAKISQQLSHAGRRARPEITGVQPVSASPIPHPGVDVVPRELTIDEIHEFEDKFAMAASRAKTAGFDAVEFHCAHLYLINDFLSPLANARTDEYGGGLEGRTRFIREIIRKTKEKVGEDYPVICRISADEYAEGGLTLNDTIKIAQKMVEAGADAIDVSAGAGMPVSTTYKRFMSSIPPMYFPRGCLVHLAEGIKKAVNVPVIAVGRINNPELAERILEEGKADLIGLGRELLADPEFPRKAAEGRVDDIRMCTGCNVCIDRVLYRLLDARCSINAALGREEQFTIKPAGFAKKVLIVGGGPAGMEAARVAALRGHDVTLYERDNKLGGQMWLAAKPPGKGEWLTTIEYLSNQVRKLGVKIELGKEVTPELVQELRPDVVIIATGAKPLIPNIPGVKGGNVVTADDVLREKVAVGEKVVIVGGGVVGVETADYLLEKGKRVVVVEKLKTVASDMVEPNRTYILMKLRENGVEILTETRVEEITERGVVVYGKGGRRTFEADTVVLAVGREPNNELIRALRFVVPELYAVGDCLIPRKIEDAIRDGFITANFMI